ncbi:asialoglycoprotein receptor 2-like isoform 2-T2 [Liasis olivaceus]
MASRPAKSQVSIIAPGSEKKRTAPQMTPFNSVSSTALWTLLTTFAIICLVVLTVVSYLYVTLVNQPPHPLEESMKKLRTTMAVGLRHPKLSDGNESLFRKSGKSGTEWQRFGNGLYYISRGKKNWYDAENFCISREAHLTSILSSEEQNYVTSQLTQPAWIGLADGHGEGRWEWTDGSRLIAQFWSQGQPGRSEHLGDREQDCTILVPWSKGLNWNEVDCNQLNRWVCKESLDVGDHKVHQTH